VAPTVDAQTRNALVYVDLPATATKDGAFKPGMFARGEFALGNRPGLTVPRQALVVRDGFNYVFLIGSDSRVRQTKVEVGSQGNEAVEITAGLDTQATLVPVARASSTTATWSRWCRLPPGKVSQLIGTQP